MTPENVSLRKHKSCLLPRGLIWHSTAVAIFFRILDHGSNDTLHGYRLGGVIFNPVSADVLRGHFPRGKLFASPGSSPNQQRQARHKCKPDSSDPGKLATHGNKRSIYQRPQELPPAGTFHHPGELFVIRKNIAFNPERDQRHHTMCSTFGYCFGFPKSDDFLYSRILS
jgi:hypothetical protein